MYLERSKHMRLNESSKQILFGNIELIKYCRVAGVSIEKIKRCNIERMGDLYVFVLSKDNVKDLADKFLEYDIDTQPDIVLTMEYKDGKGFEFGTTEFTKRVLDI